MLASIPSEHLTLEAVGACLEAPAVALHARHLAARGPLDVVDLGSVPKRPKVSVIVPIDDDFDGLRCRMGLFATDPGMTNVETVCALDRPSRRAATERFLRNLHAAYAVPFRLAAASSHLDRGEALNAAAEISRVPRLVFLDSGAVPEGPGWLKELVDFLTAKPTYGLVGAQLTFEDQSLSHAGADFALNPRGLWDIRRLCVGFPRDYAPVQTARRTLVVSSGCLAVSRGLFDRVGGFGEEYLRGACRDADLCLKVQAESSEVWLSPNPTLIRLGRDESSVAPNNGVDAAGEIDRRLLERRWRDRADALIKKPATAARSRRAAARPRTKLRASKSRRVA